MLCGLCSVAQLLLYLRQAAFPFHVHIFFEVMLLQTTCLQLTLHPLICHSMFAKLPVEATHFAEGRILNPMALHLTLQKNTGPDRRSFKTPMHLRNFIHSVVIRGTTVLPSWMFQHFSAAQTAAYLSPSSSESSPLSLNRGFFCNQEEKNERCT